MQLGSMKHFLAGKHGYIFSLLELEQMQLAGMELEQEHMQLAVVELEEKAPNLCSSDSSFLT